MKEVVLAEEGTSMREFQKERTDAISEMFDNVDEYGTLEGGLSEFTYQGAAFVPHTMTRAQIQELRQLAFKR